MKIIKGLKFIETLNIFVLDSMCKKKKSKTRSRLIIYMLSVNYHKL